MFRRTALWILTGILLFTASSAAYAQSALRIAYPAYPPFHWMKENGKMSGFFYEIISEALGGKKGLTIVWTEYPWTRCQENLKMGTDDAMITVPTAERAVYTVTHKDPFYQKPLNLFTSIDHPRLAEIKKIKKITDFRDGGFSVITYSGNGWHKENIQPLGIKTYESSYLENQWKMLAEKRGDTVIEWPPGAWPDIKRAGLSDRLVDTGVTISSMPFHLLIRKSSPHTNILADFNETVKRMKTDGTIKTILSRYY
jgi:polar amino acid transport system substrate-binding protein